MKKPLIAPSLLSADFANLQRDIEMVNRSAAHWFHIDVMDGVFVPNISYGMPVIEAIKKHAQKPLDVHLMIVQPERYVEEFKRCGADILTVHLEASTHLHRTLQAIRQAGMKTGVALNPHSPVHLLEEVITDVDVLLLMSVNPGFGGQQFIAQTYRKVAQARELITRAGAATLIEVDGGVNAANAPLLAQAGADVLVAGSFVFKSADPAQTIADLAGN